MADASQEVQQVIRRYHQAISDDDTTAALDCLGDSHLTVCLEAGSTTDPTVWQAGGYRTREDMRRLYAASADAEDSVYTTAIDFLHTHLRGNSAVVVTRETGSSMFGGKKQVWEDVLNLWCLAQIEGRWRIVGSMHHIGDPAG